MKKVVLGILSVIGLGFGTIFAQNIILPDSAEISVKDPVIEGEATNLSITMMKNGSKMSNYTGTVYFTIEEENGSVLKHNEFTLPSDSVYTFETTDLGSKEFQKGLEIKKVGTFYIKVEDLNDPDEKVLGRQQITVIAGSPIPTEYHVNIYSPQPEASVTNDKLDILASIPELPNSKALIYIDNDPAITVDIDSTGTISYPISIITIGRHSLKIEIPDIDGSILGTSDEIYFNVVEGVKGGIKDVDIYPNEGLMVGDKIKITVYSDEMVESIKMKLSDRSEELFLTKDGLGEFSYNAYLIATGDVNISLETAASNNSSFDTFENIKQFTVLETPEISNITKILDPENQSGTVSWETINGNPISSYIIKYRVGSGEISGEEETKKQSFTFNDVPYDSEISFNVTPVRKNSLNLQKHGSASETIKFIIRKPETPSTGEQLTGTNIESSRCTVENINTHTTKIGDNYYLIWDKIENVTKYIIYSSTSPDGEDKVKVYETNDTSYEYPFDYNSKEDQFLYFRIVGICDDGKEIELTGATKVQVGPAENFFLLVCLTFLIYFGIKLFRETEA